MKVHLILLFCSAILLQQNGLSTAFQITFKNNGYENIYVAIHESIPENVTLISAIKDIFIEASKFLFNATGGLAHFRKVSIVIPSSWSHQPEYVEFEGSFFEEAHVRIDHPNPSYKDNPYTLQPGHCGEEGIYIHLTPGYLQKVISASKISDGGRQLVQQWAHLRYGVFDEAGIPGNPLYPTLYKHNGKLLPTTCIEGIVGWIQKPNGKPCSITEASVLDLDCIFIPDPESAVAKASIMYEALLPSVDSFCDKREKTFHNKWAPNKQNAMCNYRSSWEVIKEHRDFKNLYRLYDVQDVNPEFNIVIPSKYSKGRYILLLDISGSMKGQRLKVLLSASRIFIESGLRTDSELGIVTFSGTASTNIGMTKVTDDNRNFLTTHLPAVADGATSIGAGLKKSLEVLSSSGNSEGNIIILITDGEENEAPMIADVLDKLIEAKVIVNCIALSQDASTKLENLAIQTGGKRFLITDENDDSSIGDLRTVFLDTVISQTPDDKPKVELKREYVTVESENTFQYIDIDSDLGTNTNFEFIGPDLSLLKFEIEDPTGSKWNISAESRNRKVKNENFTLHEIYSPSSTYLSLNILKAETGTFLINLNKTGSKSVSFNLIATSEPWNETQPLIKLHSWLSTGEVVHPQDARIFAEVKRGYEAVINATVEAVVTRPNGPKVDVSLFDNGAGADAVKNDGIYSAYFTQFNGAGRYSVVTKVNNTGEGIQMPAQKGSGIDSLESLPSKKPSSEFAIEDFEVSNDPFVDKLDGQPLEVFTRVSTAGTFSLKSWDKNVDLIPPSRITDFRALGAENVDEQNLVTLQWTCPGDNLDVGTASAFELHASPIEEELMLNFSAAFKYSEEMVFYGNMTPLPAGEQQTITVIVPEEIFANYTGPSDIYFAIRAIDGQHNAGDISPIASAHFGYPVPEKLISYNKTDSLTIGVIVMSCLVASALFIGWFTRRRIRKENQGSKYDVPKAESVNFLKKQKDASYYI